MTTETASDTAVLLDRLSRRGKLTITAEDSMIFVKFEGPGPYVRGRSTTDKADLFEHCRLGAARYWEGEGADLAALLVTCEMETRPENREVDDLVWSIECRRNSRTHGPPLPTYRRWDGWRPGLERWLRTFDHAREYRGGYERDLAEERKFNAEQRESQRRMERHERDRVKRVLVGDQ